MFRYAVINTTTGNVEGESYLSTEGLEKEHPNLIPIADDFDLSFKKWDFGAETWVEYIPETTEPSEPEPTQLDRIEAKIQTNEDLQSFYDEIVKEVGL